MIKGNNCSGKAYVSTDERLPSHHDSQPVPPFSQFVSRRRTLQLDASNTIVIERLGDMHCLVLQYSMICIYLTQISYHQLLKVFNELEYPRISLPLLNFAPQAYLIDGLY